MRKKQPVYELTAQKYLLDSEVERLEEILQHFYKTSPRDTTLIWLAFYTGARASEVLAIGPQDLDHEQKSVFIRGLKGSRNRDILIPPWLFKKLQELSPSDNRFFPITYPRFKQIWDDYRPVKKKLHALRHTFAIKVYRASKDIRALQILLGHKSLSNTIIYAEYEFSKREMRSKLFW